MSEQETRELIQKYREQYRTNNQYNVENAWEFIANSLARDLLLAKSEIKYMKSKIREMELLNEYTAKTKIAPMV